MADVTIGEAGGPTYDYGGLVAWESGEQANLTGLGIHTATIHGAWTNPDNVGPHFILAGWTMTSVDYSNVVCADDGALHHGRGWDDTAYRRLYSTIDIPSPLAYSFWNQIPWARWYGLQLRYYYGLVGRDWTVLLQHPSATGQVWDSCIISMILNVDNDSTLHQIYGIDATGGGVVYRNNIITFNNIHATGRPDDVYCIRLGGSGNICDNNLGILEGKVRTRASTIYATSNGHILKNNIGDVSRCTPGGYMEAFRTTISYDAATSNNASSDATAPGDDSIHSATFGYADYDNEDFTLEDDESGIIGGGIDLSGDFTEDIQGTERVTPWTIGPWHYTVASAEAPSGEDRLIFSVVLSSTRQLVLSPEVRR